MFKVFISVAALLTLSKINELLFIVMLFSVTELLKCAPSIVILFIVNACAVAINVMILF